MGSISSTHRACSKVLLSPSRMTGSVMKSSASLRWDCSLVLPYQLSTRRTNMKSASSHSEKPQNVKRKSTSTKSKTDWARLESKHSNVEATAEHPEASLKHIVRGIVRRGLEPLPTKSSISLRVDRDVLEWFKAQGRATKPKSIPYCGRSGMPRSNPAVERDCAKARSPSLLRWAKQQRLFCCNISRSSYDF